MMNWTPEANAKLLEMFNAGYKDSKMAAYFGIGKMALAKQRSKTGLVYYKRTSGLKRAPTIKRQSFADKIDNYALHYTKDNTSHFSNLGRITLQRAVSTAVRMIYTNNISDVIVLKSCGVIHNGSLKYRQL